MNDRMTPLSFDALMQWALKDPKRIMGVTPITISEKVSVPPFKLYEESLEMPFGPAAGPHTQLAQNIIAAYVGGARFFELKTVQTLDGEDLPVAKPCILASDEAYNVEWSTELTVPEAQAEYIKAWFALKLLSKVYHLGDPNGFIFNMSVGYDLTGIRSPKIDAFIEGLKDASYTTIWKTCMDWAKNNLACLPSIDLDYIEQISPHVSRSITLSTLHGCPPDEIERIATYLLTSKQVHTFIKCNPTLLGYTYVREKLNKMGYAYMDFDSHHFDHDLQFNEAVPLIRRMQQLAQDLGLTFGVKLTNTFPVKITRNELPGEEMYLSGRALFPLSISLATKLSETFSGMLPMSFSGGADAFNLMELFKAGLYPITCATTLLKPGGYNRFRQIAKTFIQALETNTLTGTPALPTHCETLRQLTSTMVTDSHYTKPLKPTLPKKFPYASPLLDCTIAPCTKGCPIEQDIPLYTRLVASEKYEEALQVITDKNPLPFMTGTLCNHLCTRSCRRNFYEESLAIREMKLEAAKNGLMSLLASMGTPPTHLCGHRVAIIGGGPAGLSAAYFLARSGMDVTVFEKEKSLGGVVRYIIPEFRISLKAINSDLCFINQWGISFETGKTVHSTQSLKDAGYHYIVVATGATVPGTLKLNGMTPLPSLEFLRQYKESQGALNLGRHVIVIGGGNTAMDAARAAKRVPGVETVTIVYRRTKAYMPADVEELDAAISEGILFEELLSPKDYKENQLICQRMQLGEADASGRMRPIPLEEVISLAADTIISAIGDQIDQDFFAKNQIPLTDGGMVQYDESSLEVTPNVFIAGDVKQGPATIVKAIADGRLVADTILQREQLTYPSLELNIDMATIAHPTSSCYGILKKAQTGHQEANRCLGCDTTCSCCVDVCPNRANLALEVDGQTQIVHLDALCNACGNCSAFCPYESSPYLTKFTLFNTLKDFESSTNPGCFFVDLASQRLRLRLNGEDSIIDLQTWNKEPKLRALLTTLLKDYTYLIGLGK